jgi:hypothetical protein
MFEAFKGYLSKGFYRKLLALPNKRKYVMRTPSDEKYACEPRGLKQIAENVIAELYIENEKLENDWLVNGSEDEIIDNIQSHTELRLFEVEKLKKITHKVSVWVANDGETFVVSGYGECLIIEATPMLDTQENFESEVMNSDFFTQKEKRLIIAKMKG